MAILRSLRTLVSIRNPNSNSKSFLRFSLSSSSSCSSSSSAFTSPFGPFHFQCRRSPFLSRFKFLSPLSKWTATTTPAPSRGPLFLSSPPWKLSQLATPLYLQPDLVFLPQGAHSEQLMSESEVGVDGSSALAESFLNFPNLISATRLLSGPLLGWMISNDMYLSAFIGLAISGATDWLDGYIARKMGINSVVGSYLDPLADKVLIGCVALAMVDQGLLHPGLVGLVVLRDVALVGSALFKRASDLSWEWKSWFEFFNIDGIRPQKVEPLMLSKVNTVFQLVLVAAALLQPELSTPETQSYITYLS